jgi:outer membrane protein TolC
VESAQRKVDREKEMLAHGNSSPVTVGNLDYTRKTLALKLAIAKGSFKNNIYTFKALSGVQNFNERDIPDTIAMPQIDLKEMEDEYAAFKKDGFPTSVAAKTATLRHEAVEQQIIINNAAQKPNFNFGAGVTQGPVQSNSRGNTGVDFQTILFVGITGTWNLFDNYQTSDNNRKLLAEGRGIDAKLLGTRDQLFGGAENQLSKIETGLLAIDLYKHQLGVDQDNYRKELARHEIGQGDQVDVNALRDAIYQAKYSILEYQASVAGAYYSFLTTIFRDPNLSNVDSYNRSP